MCASACYGELLMAKGEHAPSGAAVEGREPVFALPTDLRTQETLFRMGASPTAGSRRLAEKVWSAIQKEIPNWGEQPPEHFSLPPKVVEKLDPAEWNALLWEIEDERIRMGEITPRVQAFIDSRAQLDRSLRSTRERLQWEHFKVTQELMGEQEKKESKLHTELDTIVQDLARELGFDRPVVLEITRSTEFNAFVLQVAKEGGMERNDAIPLRIFVHAGLVANAQELLAATGKKLTRDHLAAILGHELAHLQQPSYHIDHPPEDHNERQRYEYDADTTALTAMDRAGYNPRAMIEIFELISRRAGQSDRVGQVIGHYVNRSHPLTENRIKELWQVYQRPDQPFFSSSKEQEPLSDSALQEVDVLLRKQFERRLDGIETIAGWDSVLETLELDPRMTLHDLERVANVLKPQMDAYAAIAQAIE
ncbi:M48 family metalloprotease, partial [Candidatus Uhrbacteria bacterium]|nr:M48 family metalloprotease [Candidatus Uhrbacteria bacterium]